MTDNDWQRVGGLDPKSLQPARHLAQNIAQWPARLLHSYMPQEPDNSHLNLTFEADRCVLATRHIRRDISMEMRLADLFLQFREGGVLVSHEMNVEERSPAQVEAWILVELLHRDVDRDRFSKDLPYEIKDPIVGDAFDYAPESFTNELRELARWYANAASALSKIKAKHGLSSEMNCRPQTLQLDVKIALDKAQPETGPQLTLGFSPGNERQLEPHFFVINDGPQQTTLAIGKTVSASEIIRDGGDGEMVLSFFDDAIGQARKHSS